MDFPELHDAAPPGPRERPATGPLFARFLLGTAVTKKWTKAGLHGAATGVTHILCHCNRRAEPTTGIGGRETAREAGRHVGDVRFTGGPGRRRDGMPDAGWLARGGLERWPGRPIRADPLGRMG